METDGRRVLRLGKRRSSWESTNPAEIAAVEFRDRRRDRLDLKPSVYLLDSSDRDRVVQVRAEHSASFMSPPPAQGTLEWDAGGLHSGELRLSEGATRFTYSRTCHAELIFENEEQLVALVASLLADRTGRAIPVSRESVLAYIDARVAASDDEWLAIVGAEGSGTGPWADALRKWRARTSQPG